MQLRRHRVWPRTRAGDWRRSAYAEDLSICLVAHQPGRLRRDARGGRRSSDGPPQWRCDV